MKTRKKLLIILTLLISCMLITACGGGKQPVVAPEPETETEAGTESDAVGWKAAYAEVLKENEEGIRSYNCQTDINGNELLNSVLLYDLCGDDIPELLFISGGSGGGRLHIYTVKEYQALECKYDVVPVMFYISDNTAAFAFVFAGGGANYMIYAGKEPGTFYAAHNIWSLSMSSSSIKYTVSDDSTVKAEVCVNNVSSNDPEGEPRDEYKINGEPVSAGEGVEVFKEHREDYGELLMYNMHYGSVDKVKDFRVFEHLNTDKPLAGSYDDVMKELS